MRLPVPSTQPYAVLRALADDIVALGPGERVAVAVDGVDGVGKTVLADQLAEVPVRADTVLLVDGIFLQRRELAGLWDATVFVEAPFMVSVPRGNARVGPHHDPHPEAESNRRYVEGQRRYLAEARPRDSATWVVDNTDLDRPVLTRGASRWKRA